MVRSKDYLIKKMCYHEDKANEYYAQIKEIEDKERLIGFKIKNDNRKSTDIVSITAPIPRQPDWNRE